MKSCRWWAAALIGTLLLAGVAVGVYTAFFERESSAWGRSCPPMEW